MEKRSLNGYSQVQQSGFRSQGTAEHGTSLQRASLTLPAEDQVPILSSVT